MREGMNHDVPVQSLIDHIKTATDVDPWAQEMAERLLKKEIPKSAEIEGDGRVLFYYYVCGECHGQIDMRDKYCRHCGNAICFDWTDKK